MDSRCFLTLSLTFLLIFPPLFRASIQIPGDKEPTKKGVFSVAFDPTRLIQLSRSPRAFTYKGFLSHQECDHLIDLAKGKLQKSTVVDGESGKSTESTGRTSPGMFLMKHQDEVVADIEARIAAWTFLPDENTEPIYILHYDLGQMYEAHYDFFNGKASAANQGLLLNHRVATVLIYLSDVEFGGETFFPYSEGKFSQQKDDSWSECAKINYAGITLKL